MNQLGINPFDAAVYVCLAVAIYAGYRSGLLRSLATILGYVIAAPVAVAVMPYLTPLATERFKLTASQMPLALFVVFFAIGLVLSALLRAAVGEISGARVSAPDRAAGAFLGGIRVALLAVVLVLVFDRLIPPGHEPAFLAGSTLRPILSQAGQDGFHKLPPEITEYIDQFQREHRG